MGKIHGGKYYSDNNLKDLPSVSSGYQEDRKQAQRDRYRKDLLQPRQYGQLNPDYFQAYPDRIKDYNLTQEEIKELGI